MIEWQRKERTIAEARILELLALLIICFGLDVLTTKTLIKDKMGQKTERIYLNQRQSQAAPLRFNPSIPVLSRKAFPSIKTPALCLLWRAFGRLQSSDDLRLCSLAATNCICVRFHVHIREVRRFKARTAGLNHRCSTLRLLESLIDALVLCRHRVSKRRCIYIRFSFCSLSLRSAPRGLHSVPLKIREF